MATKEHLTVTAADEPAVEASTPRKFQQRLFEDLGDRDWDEYTSKNTFLIKQKLAFAMFGPPSIESDLSNIDKNSTFGYSEKQMKQVLPLYEKICKFKMYSPDKRTIYMSVLFVCYVKKKNKVKNLKEYEDIEYPFNQIFLSPVFKIRKCVKADNSDGKIGCSIYIDNIGRIYKSWSTYLSNNKLPKGVLIAPESGKYQGSKEDDGFKVKLQVKLSPASTMLAKTRQVTEGVFIAATVSSVGMLAVTICAPMTAGVVIGTGVLTVATGLYGVVSSSARLADRGNHCESLSLANSEARNCWLNLTAGTAGVALGAATNALTKVAAGGILLEKGIQTAKNAVAATAAVISGIGLTNNITFCILKYISKNELPSNLELFQLASSLLFFTNSLLSNKMASNIMERAHDTQAAINVVPRRCLKFDHDGFYKNVTEETRQLCDKPSECMEIVKKTVLIDTCPDFFQDIICQNKDLTTVSSISPSILPKQRQIISPREFYSLNHLERATYVFSSIPFPVSKNETSTNEDLASTSSKFIKYILSTLSQVRSDDVLMKYIEIKITSFINSVDVLKKFILILNLLKNNLATNANRYVNLVFSKIEQLFKLFQSIYEFLRYNCDTDGAIVNLINEFFSGDLLKNEYVAKILERFNQLVSDEYPDLPDNPNCKICKGINFFGVKN